MAALMLLNPADDFARNIAARECDVEAPARISGGHADAGRGFFKHVSYLVLMRGSDLEVSL